MKDDVESWIYMVRAIDYRNRIGYRNLSQVAYLFSAHLLPWHPESKLLTVSRLSFRSATPNHQEEQLADREVQNKLKLAFCQGRCESRAGCIVN